MYNEWASLVQQVWFPCTTSYKSYNTPDNIVRIHTNYTGGYDMEFNNKTILIIGLVIGGLFSIYTNQYEIGSAIFGGLVGYLSKDYVELKDDESA